jgi:hypothetical protein
MTIETETRGTRPLLVRDDDNPIKIVYIAGAFRAATQWGIMQNVRKAESAALSLWKLGYVVICPHAMTQNYQDECPDDVWLNGMIEILKRCDAIYLLRNYFQSTGTLTELAVARNLGLPIFYEEDYDD